MAPDSYLTEKVDPYLRPLHDALDEMVGAELKEDFLKRNVIEVAPLAFMRSRTLTDAYIILDVAQNTTVNQMKMFLTRFGFGSKCVVTGDASQIDLPYNTKSGLIDCLEVLKDSARISINHFSEQSVVRHPLVAEVVYLYNQRDKKNSERKA